MFPGNIVDGNVWDVEEGDYFFEEILGIERNILNFSTFDTWNWRFVIFSEFSEVDF